MTGRVREDDHTLTGLNRFQQVSTGYIRFGCDCVKGCWEDGCCMCVIFLYNGSEAEKHITTDKVPIEVGTKLIFLMTSKE